jgi:uncharacterized protein (TIGR02266 family)
MKGKEKILIADDMETFLRLEKMLLQHAGFDIIMAKNGTEALKKIQTEKPMLIFLDLEMPEMTGDAVCRFVKSSGSLKHIPVIMVTTHSDEESRNRSFQAGANDFLCKPITKRDLFEKIKKFVPVEKRTHKRVKLRVSATTLEQDELYENYSLNISEGGIFIETDSPFLPGTELGLEFQLPQPPGPISTKGVVVRTVMPDNLGDNPAPGMGVKFTDLSSDDQKKIAEYVAAE